MHAHRQLALHVQVNLHGFFFIDVLGLHEPAWQVAAHGNLRKIEATEPGADVGEVF